MAILTPARSGLARSGATRSGYPVLQGVKVPLYALSGVARSGATRSNYVKSTIFLSLGGVSLSASGGKAIHALEVHETLGVPATARFTVIGMEPQVGQDVIITVGSTNNTAREFGGVVIGTDLTYVETPKNYRFDVHALDFTWGLNKRRVRARYSGQTVAAIAADLIATYTAGYTLQVAADIGAQVLDEITFTEQDVTDALKQLTGRVGGSWVCDYTKVVRVFFEDLSGSSPVTINAVHRSLTRIALAKDLSQVLTRVTMEGGGPNSAAWVAAGETLLPLDGDPGWFQAAGGVVVSGPQRITYGSVLPGGGGSLVGPGAAPSGPPNAALLSGVGVTAGLHLYAVSYVTATGESLPGPTVSVTTGVHDSPGTLPTVGAPTIGTGPDPGLHLWGVSFLTASGETIMPGTVAASTGLTPAPETAPVPSQVIPGVGVDDGVHDYACSFVINGNGMGGETTPSPISSSVTAGHLAPPNTPVSFDPSAAGTGPETGSHDYGVSYITSSGETTVDPTAVATKETEYLAPPTTGLTPATPTGTRVICNGGSREYVVTFVVGSGETTAGPATVQSASSLPSGFIGALNGWNDGGAYGPIGWQIGDTVYGAVTFALDASLNHLGPLGASSNGYVLQQQPGGTVGFLMNALYAGYYSSDPAVAYVQCWAYNARIGGSWHPVGGLLPNNLGGGQFSQPFVSAVNTAAAGPTSNPYYSANSCALSAIPLHPSGSGTRKIYRSAWGGGTAHKLVGSVSGTTDTFTDTVSEATLATNAAKPTSNTAALNRNNLINLPIGPEGVTQRKLWRSAIGSGALKFLATVSNNTATTYTDATPDASLGVAAPVTNTAAANQIKLTEIPRGDANVVYRNLYRRSGGAGLKLLATILNNTATTFTDAVPNASLGAAAPTISTAYLQRFHLSNIPKGDSLVTGRRIYRTVAGGSVLKVVGDIANNTATTFDDWVPDASLGAAHGGTNTATTQQVALSSIPIGASAVTQRKVYRTAAGFAQLKLLTTLADNTTTTYTDTTADGSLGANAASIDTSGLTQPSGSVPQGATTMIIATTAAFAPTGGWCLIGNGQQCVRYTGITASSLTGIPASGPGAILASVSYNSTATVPPMLTGLPPSGPGAIRYPIPKGEPVNLFVQVDDLEAQAALAALIGGDGIQVDHLQDRRLSMTETTARATAWLQLKREVLLTVRYTVRDRNSRPGRRVLINLGAPFNLLGVEFLIQSVTETALAILPNLPPTFDVVASSTRFTFDDLLRLIKRVT